MVILAVLATVFIALSLSYRAADIGVQSEYLVKQTEAKEKNYQIARSAVEMGLELLRNDTGETDSLSDYWAVGELSMVWEGKAVTVGIVDEESKFPLSAMQLSPDDCDKLYECFCRFCTKGGLGAGEAQADQFLDYVDIDNSRRRHGQEGKDSPDGWVKDSPMDRVWELRHLPAFSDLPHYASPRRRTSASELGLSLSGSSTAAASSSASTSTSTSGSYSLDPAPQAQTLGLTETSPWDEWVSVNSSGKIDINTAPKDLLLCLDEKMTPTLVDEIDTKRRSKAFTKTDDLRQVTGMDADLIFRIQDLLCVKSQNFTITAKVRAFPGPVTMRALVNRDEGLTVKCWEVQ